MGIKNIEDFYPLSPMQQGMLFHSLASPNSGVYFEQFSCTFQGDFNLVAFERAWQEVVNRHPILRTSFAWEGLKEAVQIVHRQVTLPCLQEDWRDLSSTQQQVKLEAFLEKDRTCDFELTRPPLMRLVIIQLADYYYHFIWSQHHLLLDGWSVPVVFQEVFAFYQAFTKNQNLNLATPRPYRDYIVWLQQQNINQAETFWRQTLKGFTAPTKLVTKQQQEPKLTEDYDRQTVILNSATTVALKSLAQKHQLTFNTIIQGAWALLLSRYSHEEDIVFGATISGRPATLAKAESMVGLFINTLPVRIQIDSKTFLLPWFKQIQAQQVEARQYEYTPLLKIQGWSEVSNEQPLFESIVVFENYPFTEIPLAKSDLNLEIKVTRSFDKTNYPLTLSITLDQQLSLEIAYDHHFDYDRISRMLGHLKTLLESIAANPQQHLSDFSLLTLTERQQLLIEWNDTQIDYPQDKCLHHLLEEQVARTPDAIAVVFEEQQLTYQELNQRANKLAQYLQNLGVAPEVKVGICLEYSLEMIVAVLGVLKAGGAYVPLDSAYPQKRLSFMVQDAAIKILMTQQTLVELLPQQDTQVVCLARDWQEIEACTVPLVNAVDPQNIAYMIYTSGSTDKPKGVMVSHRSLVNAYYAWEKAYKLDSKATHLQMASFSFDVFTGNLVRALCSGAKLVLSPREILLAPEQLVQLMVREKVDSAEFVPAVLRSLMEYLKSTKQGLDFMKLLIVGSDSWYVQEHQALKSLCSSCTEPINSYGLTEATIDSTYFQTSKQDLSCDKLTPIGRPFPNNQVYILDSYLQPVPIGVPGELHISSPGLARGYHQRPDLTAQKFIPHPFSDQPGERLYKTGDLVCYLPDGNLEFLGRIDNQVKIRGFRLELGEIESILGQHSEIRECVVIDQDDTTGEKQLVAYFVPHESQKLGLKQLRRFLKSRLPEYVIPAVFVELSVLPLTPNGKIDRQALPQPERSPLSSEAPLLFSHNPTLEMLAAIWSEVLNVQVIGVDDNFFELGGHSLLATRVISRVKQVFAIALPLRSLFENPTLESLAECLQTTLNPSRQLEIERVSRQEKLPLSFAQHRLWFIAQLEPDSPDYNLPAIVRLQGQLNITALEASFNEIVRRHEVLRTSFSDLDGEPVQEIAPALQLNLAIVELSKVTENQQNEQIQELIQQEAVQTFDLSQIPLFRLKLLRLNPQEHILIFVMHHIISDFWSEELLLQELTVLYESAIASKPFTLPELEIQYADFAVWQRQYLQGDLLEGHLSYWQQHLGEDFPVLHFPANRSTIRPTIVSEGGAVHNFALAKDLSDAVQTFSKTEGVTLFITLLAAFKVLLAIYTKQQDFIIGSPVANRNHLDLEPLIGFFVNTLLLRTDLEGDPSFRELVARVREVVLNGYAHQELPFEKLVEALQPNRTGKVTPLLQVWFTLTNNDTSNLQLSDLKISEIEFDTDLERYELRLDFSETNEGLKGCLGYKTDLFDSVTINFLAEYLAIILAQVIAQPDIKLSNLAAIITQKEEEQKKVYEKELAATSLQKFKRAKRKLVDGHNSN
jgi:amino acid adenylation domain-containing protein